MCSFFLAWEVIQLPQPIPQCLWVLCKLSTERILAISLSLFALFLAGHELGPGSSFSGPQQHGLLFSDFQPLALAFFTAACLLLRFSRRLTRKTVLPPRPMLQCRYSDRESLLIDGLFACLTGIRIPVHCYLRAPA